MFSLCLSKAQTVLCVPDGRFQREHTRGEGGWLGSIAGGEQGGSSEVLGHFEEFHSTLLQRLPRSPVGVERGIFGDKLQNDFQHVAMLHYMSRNK